MQLNDVHLDNGRQVSNIPDLSLALNLPPSFAFPIVIITCPVEVKEKLAAFMKSICLDSHKGFLYIFYYTEISLSLTVETALFKDGYTDMYPISQALLRAWVYNLH